MDIRKTSDVIQEIENLSNAIKKEKKRDFSDPDDWDNGTTGGQPNACVYILWAEKEDERPVYVGETVNLGKRLWEHDRPENTWTKPWEYVQYISDPTIDDGEFRLLFESFLIYVLDPIDNNLKRKSKEKNQ